MFPAEPQPRSARTFDADLREITAAMADVPEAVKVLKIAEECGEASEAYIGLRGLNPRKGVCRTEAEFVDELSDVALTALVALAGFTSSPLDAVADRLGRVVERHRAAVGGAS